MIGLILMFLLSAAIAGSLLLFASLLGPKRPSLIKQAPFECGNRPVQLPTGRVTIKFYLVALLFILFDVELMFLFPWAVVLREMGSQAFVEMFIYLAIVFSGLIYALKKGALEWD